MSSRVIFHIDVNAFFASAHIILDPSLQGKPIVVCRDVSGSVVTTASYEARAFGIHSAMPLSHAKKLCSTLQVVELDFEWYTELSDRFIEIIKSYSPWVQQASIDECYVDVTDAIKQYKKPLDLAVAIQRQVLQDLKLPVSIGVGPNKFLAKMGSDRMKPMGITVMRKREVEQVLWPLDISEMHGIGKKTVTRLRKMKINTIGDLAHASFDSLKPVLGNLSQVFINRAVGEDTSPLEVESQTKSMGQSKTFSLGISDYEELKELLIKEIEELERRLKLQGLMGKTVSFSLRLEDFKTAARSVTLDHYIDSKDDILERILLLYEEFENDGPVRFISVTLSNLLPKEEVVQQIDIFNIDSNTSIDEIIKELNSALDQSLFKKASELVGKK